MLDTYCSFVTQSTSNFVFPTRLFRLMATEIHSNLELLATVKQIALTLSISETQAKATIELLDAGNTIPFIARYRKEATQGLDEMALRAIEDALEKSRELAARKKTVLKTIDEQGLLTDALRKLIIACTDIQTLEAIYLPFKPKRRTRATTKRPAVTRGSRGEEHARRARGCHRGRHAGGVRSRERLL